MSLTPVPSDKAEDLLLNVRTIDQFTTGTALTATDRLGNSKPTLAGLIADLNADVAITATATNRAAALAAKTAAETARDATNTSGKVFTAAEGTAAGIAATTNGQNFAVVASDLLSYSLFRNNAGAAFGPLTSVYTKAFIDAGFQAFDISRYNYTWGVLGSDGRIPLGLDSAGDLLHNGDSIRALMASGDVAGSTANTFNATNFATYDLKRYGYLFALIGTDKRVPVAFTDDGKIILNGVELTAASMTAVEARTTVLEAKTATQSAIPCFGDSMTAGSGGTPYPTQLATLLPGRSITNAGVGGQTAEGIFSRWGSYPILVTLPGNVVPASGSVDFNQSSPNALPIIHSGGGPITGSIGGVRGTLSYVAQVTIYVTYTLRFTRAVAGSAVSILPNEPFIPDTSATEFSTPIFWAARNSLGLQNPTVSAADQIANVMQWHADAIAYYKPLDKHFLILGPSNRNDEYVGSPTTISGMTGETAYNTIATVNALLKAKYPKNYIDIRKLIVNARTPGTAPEDTAFSRDVPPPSLLFDGIHYNTAGYAIVASAVATRLTNLAW